MKDEEPEQQSPAARAATIAAMCFLVLFSAYQVVVALVTGWIRMPNWRGAVHVPWTDDPFYFLFMLAIYLIVIVAATWAGIYFARRATAPK